MMDFHTFPAGDVESSIVASVESERIAISVAEGAMFDFEAYEECRMKISTR